MKIFKLTLSIALLLVVLTSSVGYAINGLIGGFDDTAWYGLDDNSGYSDIAVDMKPKVWKGGSDAYYYSLNAYYSNGKNVYGGLQTNGNDGTQAVGKMAIFSVWDVGSGIAESGGTGVSFGGEGAGYSVRIKYNWSVGTSYRFKIYIAQNASSGNRIWAASVTNLSTGATQRIGRIYVPVSYGKVHSPVTFHERYLGGSKSCSDLSPSEISFTNMTANSGKVKASSWSHYYKANVPSCNSLIWVQDTSNGYVSGIGLKKPASPAPKAKASTSSVPTIKVRPKPKPISSTKKTGNPAPTKTPPSMVNKTALPDQTIRQPSDSSPRNGLIFAIVAGLSVAIICALLWLSFLKRKKFRKFITKHFPYDYDIHS